MYGQETTQQLRWKIREQTAIIKSYDQLKTDIDNLVYFLLRHFPEDPACDVADHLPDRLYGVIRRLLLELKSRRQEQGPLCGHPTDDPLTRIRIYLDQHFPLTPEQLEITPISMRVIDLLEQLKQQSPTA